MRKGCERRGSKADAPRFGAAHAEVAKTEGYIGLFRVQFAEQATSPLTGEVLTPMEHLREAVYGHGLVQISAVEHAGYRLAQGTKI